MHGHLSICATLLLAVGTRSFFLEANLIKKDNQGTCVMYGECEHTPSGALPCTSTEPAGILQDPKARQILKNLCPDLYTGSNTKTCCDAEQLNTMEKNMELIRQLFSRCPSCLHNFMNIFCQMTCSPKQSTFLKVTSVENHSVRSLNYVISHDFTYGMFNSCKNVELPSANDKALSVICGRSAKTCTPGNLLDYIGSTSSGTRPFDISFIISNKNVTIGGEVYYPMNQTTSRCLDTCSVRDCGYLPKPRPCPNGSCFDGHVRPIYREEQIVVTRPHNDTVVTHRLPAPSTETVKYTSLFDKEFLHILLDFQDRIKNITVQYENQLIRLEDICYRPNGQDCAEISILEYWQNNHKAIEKVKMDAFGFFILADYLDHLSTCAAYPPAYDFNLNMSCLSTANQTISPNMVLAGYGAGNGVEYYNSSTAFVTTFLVQNYQDDRMNAVARAWEAEFRNFVETFPKTNMTVSVNTPTF